MEPSGSGEDGPGQETVEKLGEEESQPHSRVGGILGKRMDRRPNGKERENGPERERVRNASSVTRSLNPEQGWQFIRRGCTA